MDPGDERRDDTRWELMADNVPDVARLLGGSRTATRRVPSRYLEAPYAFITARMPSAILARFGKTWSSRPGL